MTQAFNLSQLANNLNTSGQLDATDGLTGAVPVANGGTGQTSLSANGVLLGNGTSGVQTVAPSTSGNVLVSNGTTWVSQAPAGGGVTSLNGQTGAITNTSLDAIGSIITAVHAVTASPWTGSGTTNVTLNCGDTVAGSALRRNYNQNGVGAFTPASTGVGSPYTSPYNQGGTALSGTWRCMGRSAGWRNYVTGNYSVGIDWESGMFVRIS